MGVGDIMKLNKNGWGLRVELLFIVLFLFCLLIATIGLNKLGLFGGPGLLDGEKTYSYSELENNMNEAAKRYYQNNYENNVSDTIIIKSSTLLLNGYMSNMLDENGNVCSGYTRVFINYQNEPSFNTYINCPRYKTAGYD